jgi:hypothetical protein
MGFIYFQGGQLMPNLSLMPMPKLQFFDNSGSPLSGGLIYTYDAGTTNPKMTYTSSTGLTPNSNPVVLDSAGRASIWLSGYYTIAVYDSLSNLIYTQDNVSSMPSAILPSSQWVTQPLSLTYISGTQFSVPGDSTALLPVNQRIQCQVSAGIITGTITVSSYTPPSPPSPSFTTVTVLWDSGALDSGLSAIAVGIITPTSNALPLPILEQSATSNTNTTSLPTMNVKAGDRIYFTVQVSIGSGQASFRHTIGCYLTAGDTATIQFAHNLTSAVFSDLADSSGDSVPSGSGVIKVTGSGTLTLKSYAYAGGGSPSYSYNQIYIFFIKKVT